VDPRLPATLQSQIVEQFRVLIAEERLPAGSAVPSTRELAKQLGVSRNTIASAYEVLISEGYLYAEPAAGTFVCKTIPDEHMRTEGSGLEARSAG
jgi:GntR family transcriptional regulator/MocR family aminotransferase